MWSDREQGSWSDEKLLAVRQQAVALLRDPRLQQHWSEAWALLSAILLPRDPHSPLALAADVGAWLSAGLAHALVDAPGAQERSAVHLFSSALCLWFLPVDAQCDMHRSCAVVQHMRIAKKVCMCDLG